jgi:hypothetical protein
MNSGQVLRDLAVSSSLWERPSKVLCEQRLSLVSRYPSNGGLLWWPHLGSTVTTGLCSQCHQPFLQGGGQGRPILPSLSPGD